MRSTPCWRIWLRGRTIGADHADQEDHRRAADRRSAHREPAARGHPRSGRTRQLPAQDHLQGDAPGQPLPLAHRRDHRRRPRPAPSPTWPHHMTTGQAEPLLVRLTELHEPTLHLLGLVDGLGGGHRWGSARAILVTGWCQRSGAQPAAEAGSGLVARPPAGRAAAAAARRPTPLGRGRGRRPSHERASDWTGVSSSQTDEVAVALIRRSPG